MLIIDCYFIGNKYRPNSALTSGVLWHLFLVKKNNLSMVWRFSTCFKDVGDGECPGRPNSTVVQDITKKAPKIILEEQKLREIS